MNTQPGSTYGRTEDLNHLHDLALSRAHESRQEAVDDFWRGADAMWVATMASACRSAQRLAHRLARRSRAQASGKVVE